MKHFTLITLILVSVLLLGLLLLILSSNGLPFLSRVQLMQNPVSSTSPQSDDENSYNQLPASSHNNPVNILSSPAVTSASTTSITNWTNWAEEIPGVSSTSTLSFLFGSDHSGAFYAKDNYYIYFCCYTDGGYIVANANPETFTLIGTGYYAKDAFHVYVEGVPLKNVDLSTFRVLDDGNLKYAMDKNAVYFNIIPISGANPASFGFYDAIHNYSHDNSHVFYDQFIVASANPQTFRPVSPLPSSDNGYQYGKDDAHVFFDDSPVMGADPTTFVVLKAPRYSIDAQDNAHKYYRGVMKQ